MRTKLLTVIFTLWSIFLLAQTNGWYQIDKPQTINVIVPDDTDSNIIHLGTNIGYIKFNIATNQVVDFLNATSQNPAIGNVTGLALNPTNNEIALALSGGIAIYDGTSTVTKYTYTNSSLTIGSASNLGLQLSYGLNGELYLYKTDVFGYQVLNSGVFNTEVVTSFRPQDIEENHDGTKIYFAGWNDGLHEYTKASTSWVNYTTSNSDLIYNPLEALYRDSSGKLYVGGFQGFNTIDSAGVWSTVQQMIPSSVFFYPAYDFSKNSSGDLMVVTSKPNVAYNGLCIVNEGSNTWTRYYQDGANCLNSNTFTAASFGGNDKIYAAPQVFFGYGKLVEFVPSTDTCTDKDINYLNAPEIGDYTTFFTVRNKTNGSSRGGNFIELVYKDNSTGFGSAELNPPGFNGQFNSTQQTPAPSGDQVWSIQSHNETLFCETNDGILFIDGDNNQIPFDHNIPNFYSTKIIPEHVPTNAGATSDVINVIIQGVQSGENKLFKTQCTKSTGSCTAPEEIVLSNIDNVQPIKADLARNQNNETVLLVAKTNSSGNEAFSFHKWLDFLQPKTDISDKENSAESLEKDPKIINSPHSFYNGCHVRTSSTTGINFIEVAGGSEIVFWSVDANGQVYEEVIGFTRLTGTEAIEAYTDYSFISATFLPINTRLGSATTPLIGLFSFNPDPNNPQTIIVQEIPDSHSASYLSDMVIFDTQVVPYETNKLLVAMLTNYGFLIKTNVNVSHLLSNENFYLTDPIRISPNPSNNQVKFNSDKISLLTVYDINGRKVLEKEGNSFSVKNLAKGVYLVHGKTNENHTVAKKLIVD